MDIQKIGFGDFCTIEQKRYVGPNEFYSYKVVGRKKSNVWTDVPVDANNEKETSHDHLDDVVTVVCNNLDDRTVHQFRISDLASVRKSQTVPEGFVLVPKEKISYFWQDNDEPENFCSNESDFDCLGDCIDLGEIIEINKFTQAHINKEKLFGTWFAEAIDPSEKANFFVGNHAECLEIVAKNKAMIEAQEQSHD